MQQKLISLFVCSACVMLLVTTIAKILNSDGSARILQNANPVFANYVQHVFWIFGVVELSTELACLLNNRIIRTPPPCRPPARAPFGNTRAFTPKPTSELNNGAISDTAK